MRRPLVKAVLVALLLSGCQLIAGITDRAEGIGSTRAKSCLLKSDCGAGQVCIFAQCSLECHEDIDCNLGQRCLGTAKETACVSPIQARCDAHGCPDGTACGTDGTCRTVCGAADAGQCRGDQTCGSSGLCYGKSAGHDPTASVDGGPNGTGGAPGDGGGSSAGGRPSDGGGSGAGGSIGAGGSGLGDGGDIGAGGVLGAGGGSAGGFVGNGGLVGSGGATAGATGSGGATGAGGNGNAGSTSTRPDAAYLPSPTATCPTLATGTVAFKGLNVQLWVGPGSGMLIFYWHATGSNSQEAVTGLGQATIDQIQATGGVVASFTTTTSTGTNTGNNVWYTGDFAIADEVLACALQQNKVDIRHIHTAGFSAGGLQVGAMSYLRSGYLASVGIQSGGAIFTYTAQAPNVPDAFVAHGATGSDVVIVDFANLSSTYASSVKTRGGFAVECGDTSGHTIHTATVPYMYQFLEDHPFGVAPEPWAGGNLPSGIPTYCKAL